MLNPHDPPQRKTVIISPVRIIEQADGDVQICWGAAEEPSAKTKTAVTATQGCSKF